MSRLGCLGWLLGSLIAIPVAVTGAHVRETAAPATPATPTQIRVVGGMHSPPFLFVGADGKPQGYEADVWRLFEAHTGIRVDLEPMDRSAARQQVLSGRADVVDLIYRTPSRDALYDFSAAYASQPIGIYVDRHIRGVHDIASLRGFPVGVERGDSCSEKLASLGHKEFREYPEYSALVDDVVRGNLRIFCMDRDAADYYLYRESALARFDMAFTVYTGHPRWAVRQGNTRMLQLVQHGMSLITPAEREQLQEKWLQRPGTASRHLRDLLIPGLVIAVVVALMALWVWLLRCSVARRTRQLRAERNKLRALFDASPDGMWLKDRDGRYRDCNDGAAALMGVTRAQLIGGTNDDVLDARNAALVKALDAEVMRLGQRRVQMFRPRAEDGSTRQVEIVKVPVRREDGSVSGVLSVSRDITERLQVEEQLGMWVHAFQNAAFGVEICDLRSRRITAVNPTFARERGYTPEEMVGMPIGFLYADENIADETMHSGLDERTEHVLAETEHVTRDGRRFPVLLDCSVFHDENDQPTYALIYAQDITSRRQAEDELKLAATAFEIQEPVLILDCDGRIQRVNEAFTRLTGFQPGEVVGQPGAMLTSRSHQQVPSARELLEEVRARGFWQGERWIEVKVGQPRLVRSTVSAVRDASGAMVHMVYAMVDLTGERAARASVDRMTFFDPLTDLPNRNHLHDQLRQAIAADVARAHILLLFDLDHFKRVNDLRGHAAGDRLLVLIAQRLRKQLDSRCTLSRFSGGTFALIEGCGDGGLEASQHAEACAARIRESLRKPFDLGGDGPVEVTVSVGWTTLTPGRGSPEIVLREVELAMYDAKDAGRDGVRGYRPSMQEELVRHDALVQDLRRAIAQNGLDLHYQAQVDGSGCVTGAEALLRWVRPCGERVSPAVFVPLAEENGLILPLGNWALRHACRQLVAWAGQPATRGLSLAVNVSARQFVSPRFVAGVREVLDVTGADPARLKLEITESAIMDDLAGIAAKLAELRALGIRISLDDFGTGYSSLAYLSRLPLDQLKIDQSFVARLPEDANDVMVAKSIISMGRGLGLEVIAEGVETEAQWRFLTEHGCDAFQGYLFARPMPAVKFEALLAEPSLPVRPSGSRGTTGSARVVPLRGRDGRFPRASDRG